MHIEHPNKTEKSALSSHNTILKLIFNNIFPCNVILTQYVCTYSIEAQILWL